MPRPEASLKVKGSSTLSPSPCPTSWQHNNADDESIVLSDLQPCGLERRADQSTRWISQGQDHVLAAQVPCMHHSLGRERVPPRHNKDRTYRGQWLGFDARVLEWQRSDTDIERDAWRK
jgi:hypothetical protein